MILKNFRLTFEMEEETGKKKYAAPTKQLNNANKTYEPEENTH